MKTKAEFRAMLDTARRLADDGEAAAAQRLLAQVAADPGVSVLGQATVLGPPRQVQAAALHLAKVAGDRVMRTGLQYHLVPPPGTLARHGRFSDEDQRAMALANRRAVPRVIHQIWIGGRPPPVTTDAWRRHARARGFRYRLWREADLAAAGLAADPVFAARLAQGDYPGAVDVARYAILLRHGGLYLDCDWYPARSDLGFADLLPLRGLTALAEPVPRLTGQGPVLLANSLIGAPPGHPVMARIVAALPQAAADLPGAPAWWATGPLLFSVIARGGSVALAPASLIAGEAPPGASAAEVAAMPPAGGLLIAWKPW